MGDGPSYAITRMARNAYRSLFGGDTNLPIETAVPAAQRRKKEQDSAQGEAIRKLGALVRGKSPLKK